MDPKFAKAVAARSCELRVRDASGPRVLMAGEIVSRTSLLELFIDDGGDVSTGDYLTAAGTTLRFHGDVTDISGAGASLCPAEQA